LEIFAAFNYKLVSCSGGKDSTAPLAYVSERLDGVKALFVDTGCGVPGVREYLSEVCQLRGVQRVVVRPDPDFFKLAGKWGFPTPRRRWCCYYLKLKPIRDYVAELSGRTVMFLGLRMGESQRRRTVGSVYWDKTIRCIIMNPIRYWTGERVIAYLRSRGIPRNPVSRVFGNSMECACGAYATKKQMRLLRAHAPDLFRRLCELEGKMRKGASYAILHGKRAYLRDLIPQRLITDYLANTNPANHRGA